MKASYSVWRVVVGSVTRTAPAPFATSHGAQIHGAERITFKGATKDGMKVGYGYLDDR